MPEEEENHDVMRHVVLKKMMHLLSCVFFFLAKASVQGCHTGEKNRLAMLSLARGSE